MIDFVSATKYRCKGNIYLGNCKPFYCALNNSGWETYYLEGCEKMQVHYKPEIGIRVQGSLPYFLQGHNFKFENEGLIQAVDFIDSLLGSVGLWGAIVNAYEFGAIMQVEQKPKDYIANHYADAGSHLKAVINGKYEGKFAQWQRPDIDLKMYDAGANILMKQDFTRRAVIESVGWNPASNYLKVEARHKKPFLNGKPVYLETLQNKSFIESQKAELMEQYHLLKPKKSIVMPSDKKNLTSLDAVLITLIENSNMPVDQVKKLVYKTINQADCLNKPDKDSRKAHICKAFGKIEEAPESKWDLSDKLEEALQSEK